MNLLNPKDSTQDQTSQTRELCRKSSEGVEIEESPFLQAVRDYIEVDQYKDLKK